VASPEGNVSLVGVASTLNIEALTSVVSQVSSASWEVGGSLVVLVGPWSQDSVLSDSIGVSISVGDGVVSLCVSSDGSGSSVKDEPLVVTEGSVVLDSQSVLMSSNMLVP